MSGSHNTAGHNNEPKDVNEIIADVMAALALKMKGQEQDGKDD